MSVNLQKCSNLSDKMSARLHGAAHPSTAGEPETLPLPPGFDASLFTPDQTEYISDLFVATVKDYLNRLDSLLDVTEPGVAPTASRIGTNWLILRKLAGLSHRHALMTWRNLRIAGGVKPQIFNSQRKALFSFLRSITSQPLTRLDHGTPRRR